MLILKVGTRKSPLALKQVEEVVSALRIKCRGVLQYAPTTRDEPAFEIVGIDTYGDIDKIMPISDIEGSDFFTREIDEALLKGEVDFAVHSAKDLPDEIPKGLTIAAVTKSIDPYDALVLNPALTNREIIVSKGGVKIGQLKKGARIGASSQRRKEQLKRYRGDFEIVDIRGNIEERIELLDEGRWTRAKRSEASPKGMDEGRVDLDAIIVASCALKRLGLEDRISQRIPFEILTPHPLQGSLAVAVREDDKQLIELLKALDAR